MEEEPEQFVINCNVDLRTCCAESMQIAARVLLFFLGLKVKPTGPEVLQPRSTEESEKRESDVFIEKLGGRIVDIQRVTELCGRQAMLLLAKAYRCGSQATAHLTYGTESIHRTRDVIDAVPHINRLFMNSITEDQQEMVLDSQWIRPYPSIQGALRETIVKN